MTTELEQTKQQPGDPNQESLSLLFRMIAIAVVLWVLYWVGVDTLIPQDEERGTFGDKFGGVNALFAALAFAGLIYTVVLQKRELGYQRQELIQTREELAGQREQMRLQNATLRRQSFENTFFQLLRLHHEIVAGMELPVNNNSSISGRRAFRGLYDELQKHLHEAHQKHHGNPGERAETAYQSLYERRHALLGHYFRNMYQMVKLAHEEEEIDGMKYTSLVRDQLSADEHILLFYYGLSEFGRERFYPLIEEYALLEGMPAERLYHPDSDIPMYSQTAFGSDGARPPLRRPVPR